jgi:type IX secretion system PorP/SprF family membrane protein
MQKVIFSLILFLSPVSLCIAQQIPIYSQFILNEFLINPSVAGIDGMTTLNLSGRKQWWGIKHTPETYTASVATRILKSPFSISGDKMRKGSKGRVGLGAAFMSDKNGAISRTNLQLTYAYHIFIQNNQLSFGLKAYTTQLKIDESLIDLDQPDPEIEGLLGKSTYIPDAGAGISFSTPNAHLGISAVNLFQSPIKFGDVQLESTDFKHIRQYYLYGYIKKVLPNNSWEIEPALLLRANEDLRFSADISARLIYNREYWAGLALRTSGELILLMGLKINKFYLGYSFDYGFNQLSYRSYGSHEVVLALKLGDSTRRYKWLERY